MRTRSKRVLVSTIVGGLLSVASLAQAEPAMWVIKDDDSTLYLLGTMHALRPGIEWKTPKITQALEESTQLWLEIADVQQQGMLQLTLKYGYTSERKLSQRLKKAQKERLARALEPYAFPMNLLEGMKPWYAAMTILQLPVFKAGYNPNHGVEPALTMQARIERDGVIGFETAQEQLEMLDKLPLADQMTLLDEAIRHAEEGTEQLERMAKAWSDGDLGPIEADLEEMKEKAPALYRRLMIERNVRWSGKIAELLDDAGVQMIAVGAAHFAGPDSVHAHLLKKGIKAERY
jgi:uncharacterized protein